MTEEQKVEFLKRWNTVTITIPAKDAIEALESLEGGWHLPCVRSIIREIRETLEE